MKREIQMKEITFKSKKWPLFLGIAMIVVIQIPLSCLFVYFMFFSDMETMEKVIGGIVGGTFLIIWLICAILVIQSYFETGKKIRGSLKKYGEKNLLKNIQEQTVCVYRSPFMISNQGVYFTDRFVIDPGEGIFEYTDISLMYKHVIKNSSAGVLTPGINFELLDGSTYFLCRYIEDKQIHEYMQVCYQHNPQILIGYTKENLDCHKERLNAPPGKVSREEGVVSAVEENKISPQQSEVPVLEMPKQWTPEGRKLEMGKRMYHMGILSVVLLVIMDIIVSVIIIAQGPLFMNEIVTAILLSAVFFPGILAFALLAFFGKRRMKKYAYAEGENVESTAVI